jgi:hypothetical protein
MRCLNEPEVRIAGRETLLMAYEQAQPRPISIHAPYVAKHP